MQPLLTYSTMGLLHVGLYLNVTCTSISAIFFGHNVIVFLHVLSDAPAIFPWDFPSSLSLRLHTYHFLGSIRPLPSFLWPYHRSRSCLRKVVIGSMLASLQISSFLMWSFFFLPPANLSIIITVVCCFFLTTLHSDPYAIVGSTKVL